MSRHPELLAPNRGRYRLPGPGDPPSLDGDQLQASCLDGVTIDPTM